MKLIKNILYILFLSIFISCANAQQGECVFDEKSITEDFLKNNPEIQSYIWFNDAKVATVLMKTGEYVFVKKWACTSYGMEVKKVIMFPTAIDENISFWRENLLTFGKQFLDKADFEVYKSVIYSLDWAKGKEKLTINSKYEINIPHDNYPEFYVTLERNIDMVMMTFYYYMN